MTEQIINHKLSFILLSYYSSTRLKTACNRIAEVMEANKVPFEVVIIDDGSKDASFSIAMEIERADSRVKAYQLSRNFTSHYAAFAGLSVCTGSCAVLVPDDEQLPYKDIAEMYRQWQKGHKVIIPHREVRDESFVKRNISILFYGLMNRFSDIEFPPGGADSFMIDREVIDVINRYIHPIRTTTISEILRLGYDPVFYPYHRPDGNNNKSRWTFKKKYALAKDFFFSSSTFPIRFITYIGIGFSFFSFILILVYSYGRLLGNPAFWRLNEVPGWVSTIVFISFFSGLILFSLGILAEYIWRIYEEVKGRPGYLLRKKKA